MIIWTKNQPISDILCNQIIKNIKLNHKNKDEYYTNFFDDQSKDVLQELIPFYKPIMETMTKDLGIFHKSKFTFNLWVQMNNSDTDSHESHTHFTGMEQLSWVHFINVPDQKCFYFENSRGEKIYPNIQKINDIIAFPSWASHGVDKVKENNFDRIICAGNIRFNEFHSDGNSIYMSVDDNVCSYQKV